LTTTFSGRDPTNSERLSKRPSLPSKFDDDNEIDYKGKNPKAIKAQKKIR
jgi:hypothetical protein